MTPVFPNVCDAVVNPLGTGLSEQMTTHRWSHLYAHSVATSLTCSSNTCLVESVIRLSVLGFLGLQIHEAWRLWTRAHLKPSLSALPSLTPLQALESALQVETPSVPKPNMINPNDISTPGSISPWDQEVAIGFAAVAVKTLWEHKEFSAFLKIPVMWVLPGPRASALGVHALDLKTPAGFLLPICWPVTSLPCATADLHNHRHVSLKP